jgi:hypothetical protein
VCAVSRVGPLVGFLAWMTLTGCSSGPVEIKGEPGGANLAKIGIAYARASEHLGRPPQKLEELKSFLKKEYGEADSLLRSTEDGQPFQIIWGVDIFQAPAGSTAPTVVAYEKQGVNGKRYVLTVGVAVLAMTKEEFAQAHFPKGRKPTGGG